MKTLRVGISAAREEITWGAWKQQADLLPFDYARAVQEAGAIALILPVDPAYTVDATAIIDGLDALILSGGIDIDPSMFEAERDPMTGRTDPTRDRFELALIEAAKRSELPTLGVCRGMQLINVAFGGTLVQHLPDRIGNSSHCEHPGNFSHHAIDTLRGSLTAKLVAGENYRSWSHHHQGIDRLGDGLVATAWSRDDSLIEGLESPENDILVGVQWHPEADPESTLIHNFIEEARR